MFLSANSEAVIFVGLLVGALLVILSSIESAQKELEKNAEKIKKDAKDMDEITNGKKNRTNTKHND